MPRFDFTLARGRHDRARPIDRPVVTHQIGPMTVDDANLELFGSPDEVDAPEGPPQHSLRAPGVGVPAGSEHATELFADEGAIGDVVDPDTENPDPLDPDTTAPDTGGPDSPHPDTTALETAARAANDEGSPRDAAVRLPPVWTVSMVNRRVRELVEGTVPPLWVRGEVANWTRARSGHRYFTLKDELAQIRAVMFRNDAERLPVDPDEGMTVRAFGSVTLYETRGEYQITVRTLEAEGDEGLWRIAFERVRLKLEKEGLLAAGRKRPLPRFPRCVGVVTSPTGAALRDVLSVINGRAPWTRVVVKSTRVQGDGAALEIAAAIDALARSGACGHGHRSSRRRLHRRSLGVQRRGGGPGNRGLPRPSRFGNRTRSGRHHRGSRG